MPAAFPGDAWWAWLSSWAALATALGTLPVLLSHQFSQRTYDTLLGFGAGVMLAASSFSLIIPALASARLQGASAWGTGGIVGAGIMVGALFLMGVDRLVPHEHFIKGREGREARALKRVWLFVLAIGLHNLPEGDQPVGQPAALGTGRRCRCHAVRHQPRDHSRIAPRRP